MSAFIIAEFHKKNQWILLALPFPDGKDFSARNGDLRMLPALSIKFQIDFCD